jgi:hypothetical protein
MGNLGPLVYTLKMDPISRPALWCVTLIWYTRIRIFFLRVVRLSAWTRNREAAVVRCPHETRFSSSKRIILGISFYWSMNSHIPELGAHKYGTSYADSIYADSATVCFSQSITSPRSRPFSLIKSFRLSHHFTLMCPRGLILARLPREETRSLCSYLSDTWADLSEARRGA